MWMFLCCVSEEIDRKTEGGDILDDDVLGTVGDTETFASDYTCGADADEGLVGAEIDGAHACFVVGHDYGGCASPSIAVRAPVESQNVVPEGEVAEQTSQHG